MADADGIFVLTHYSGELGIIKLALADLSVQTTTAASASNTSFSSPGDMIIVGSDLVVADARSDTSIYSFSKATLAYQGAAKGWRSGTTSSLQNSL